MAVVKAAHKTRIIGVDPQDFSPSLLRVQTKPLAPFASAMLRLLLVLLFAPILWWRGELVTGDWRVQKVKIKV